MKHRYILMAVLALAVVLVALWESSITAYPRLQMGLRYENPMMVIKAANQLLQSNPDDRSIFIQAMNGKIFAGKNQIAQAYTLVNDMIAKDPNDPNLYIIRAHVFLAQGRPNKAIGDYERAKELVQQGYPKSPPGAPSDDIIEQWAQEIRDGMQKDAAASTKNEPTRQP